MTRQLLWAVTKYRPELAHVPPLPPCLGMFRWEVWALSLYMVFRGYVGIPDTKRPFGGSEMLAVMQYTRRYCTATFRAWRALTVRVPQIMFGRHQKRRTARDFQVVRFCLCLFLGSRCAGDPAAALKTIGCCSRAGA